MDEHVKIVVGAQLRSRVERVGQHWPFHQDDGDTCLVKGVEHLLKLTFEEQILHYLQTVERKKTGSHLPTDQLSQFFPGEIATKHRDQTRKFFVDIQVNRFTSRQHVGNTNPQELPERLPVAL